MTESSAVANPTASSPGEKSAGRRVATFAVIGLVAAALGVMTIIGIGEQFRLPKELVALGIGGPPGPDAQARIVAGNTVLKYKHFALWFGAVGAVWGVVFGLAKTLAGSGSANRGRAVAAGLIFGGLVGVGSGLASNTVDIWIQKNVPPGQLSPPEHMPFLLHGVTWLIMGLAVGIGVAAGSASKKAADVVGGSLSIAMAAALGGILYPLLTAFVLPTADVTQSLPEHLSGKCLWMGLPAVLIGMAVGRQK